MSETTPEDRSKSNMPSPSEYASLRSEIATYLTQIITLSTWSITATAAILTVVLRDATALLAPLAVACPLLVIVPAAIAQFNARRSILRIASYLRTFGGNGQQYENALQALRQRATLPLKGFWFDYSKAIVLPFQVAALACCLTCAVLIFANESTLPLAWRVGLSILALALAVCLACWLYRTSQKLKSGGSVEAEFDREWGRAWEQLCQRSAPS